VALLLAAGAAAQQPTFRSGGGATVRGIRIDARLTTGCVARRVVAFEVK